MSKDLEALDYLTRGMFPQFDTPQYKVVKQALQRLESIDNAKPSEALELLKETKRRYFNFEYGHTQQYIDHWKNLIKTLDIIEQALLKSQEQEKEIDRLETKCLNILADNIKLESILKVIKEKNVMVYALKVSKTVDDYNDLVSTNEQLTEEEFDLLKRYFEQ